jgi:hypothetical protein
MIPEPWAGVVRLAVRVTYIVADRLAEVLR